MAASVYQSRFNKYQQIIVTFQREGIHRFPDAGTDSTLATGGWDDVSFLAYPHRHIFHFTVTVEVGHDNRDIEFIQLKRFCERLYNDGVLQLDYKSCEMMADDLYEAISKQFPNRNVQITIMEDNENGATAYYDKNNNVFVPATTPEAVIHASAPQIQ